MDRLRRSGAGIVDDDFGTVEASLSNLMWLEADGLRIDRSFTAEILGNPRCAAIVEAILTLGERLDPRGTAEGVETPSQLRWLRRRNCPAVRGFLLAEPAPLDEALQQVRAVGDRLRRHSRRWDPRPAAGVPRRGLRAGSFRLERTVRPICRSGDRADRCRRDVR